MYVGQECVVDVIMSPPDKTFTADHKTLIMSSGKSVAAILLARLVDKNLLSYDDLVTKHWPEYGQNGKENQKVEDVMRHEAGIWRLPK